MSLSQSHHYRNKDMSSLRWRRCARRHEHRLRCCIQLCQRLRPRTIGESLIGHGPQVANNLWHPSEREARKLPNWRAASNPETSETRPSTRSWSVLGSKALMDPSWARLNSTPATAAGVLQAVRLEVRQLVTNCLLITRNCTFMISATERYLIQALALGSCSAGKSLHEAKASASSHFQEI